MEHETVWNEIASSWKEYRQKTPVAVLEFLSGKKGKVLDLGCGSGRNFILSSGISYYGVDFSSPMIDLARKTAKEKGIDLVEIKKAEVFETSYPSEFFDYVVCFSVVNCIDSEEKRKKTLEEIFRVLKKGGSVLICSWGRGSSRIKNCKKECYINWTIDENRKVRRYTYIYDLNELEDLCSEVGFEIVKSWEDGNVCLVLRKSF
ncbi:MAG: class I SAM-dependent methyltransferase [archaeon]